MGWLPWVVKVACAAESAAVDLCRRRASGHQQDGPGGTAEPDDLGSQCPSCRKLMTICYKKGSRGGIQSDSLHSGSSHQLRAFFLMKVCFCTVNDLWQGLKCIALTMPTHFEHSK